MRLGRVGTMAVVRNTLLAKGRRPRGQVVSAPFAFPQYRTLSRRAWSRCWQFVRLVPLGSLRVGQPLFRPLAASETSKVVCLIRTL